MAASGTIQDQYQEITIPSTFVWPDDEKPSLNVPNLQVPVINLNDILSADSSSEDVHQTLKTVNEACRKHGFFVIVNHGVGLDLIEKAHKQFEQFFNLPLEVKDKANTKMGDFRGKYKTGFTNMYGSKNPWKEDLSFRYCNDLETKDSVVHKFFVDIMGENFDEFG